MLQSLSILFNVLLMIVGFGLVIVVHEFGHFAAARWAGVRVHTFAVGFGTAICTWRKGLGFRWGSSEAEYFGLQRNTRLSADPTTAEIEDARRAQEILARTSPTEYRLNWFPFGGYVKMLGQEDLSPIPSLTASDSFAAKPVWKRMIIMSGGVAMNLVLAGVLFIVAYSYGIKEVAPIVGDVGPGTPAQVAGLRAGDRVLSIDGDEATTFNDLRLAAAMGSPKSPIKITVARDGESEPIILSVTPRRGPDGMLQIGVAPAPAATLVPENELKDPSLRAEYLRQLQDAGLGSVTPGMRLVSVNGTPIPKEGTTPHDTPTANVLRAALETSNGAPVAAFFEDSGITAAVSLTPQPELQTAQVKIGDEDYSARHLLGLVPVMRVASTTERAAKAGLLPGDVFARIGSVEWPSIAAGIAQVRAHKGKSLDLVVLRDGALVELKADVSREGQIGFLTGDTSASDTLIGFAKDLEPVENATSTVNPNASAADKPTSPQALKPSFPAARLTPGLLPGSRIRAVAGTPVANFRELREALKSATAAALARNEPANIPLTLELPIKDDTGAPRTEEVALPLASADVASLHALGWDGTQAILCFDLAQFLDQATGPVDALKKGVAKTHYVVMMTYVTFLRLFQGTVPVDQLHGPVGITHIGSQVAERGLIYLFFFLGLISANLAVINFLPLPIVDGGHMVFLLIEAITRKPVSAAVQNTAIIAGLLLVGSVFVVVTFNDLVRLFG